MKNRMKRTCVIVLALIMAMAMGISSGFAADEYEPVKGGSEAVKIAKTLDLKGSTNGPEHTVTFTTTYQKNQSSPSGQDIIGSVNPVEMTFSGNIDEKEAFIDFSTVQFKLPGTYRFRVTETIAPSGLGIRAKSGSVTIYTVLINVINTNDGAGHSGLEIESYKIYKGDSTSNTDKATSLLFENEWDNYRIKVKKDVTGLFGDKTKPFTIYVNLDNFGSGNKVTVRWVSGTPAVGSNPSTAEKVTVANPVTVQGSSSTWSPITLQLKDSDEVLLEGLSSSMNFYITEPATTGYEASGTFGAIDKKSVVDENDKEFVVVNKSTQTVPTGLFINNWPYIAVVLIAIAACIVFIRRRKSRYEREEDL